MAMYKITAAEYYDGACSLPTKSAKTFDKALEKLEANVSEFLKEHGEYNERCPEDGYENLGHEVHAKPCGLSVVFWVKGSSHGHEYECAIRHAEEFSTEECAKFAELVDKLLGPQPEDDTVYKVVTSSVKGRFSNLLKEEADTDDMDGVALWNPAAGKIVAWYLDCNIYDNGKHLYVSICDGYNLADVLELDRSNPWCFEAYDTCGYGSETEYVYEGDKPPLAEFEKMLRETEALGPWVECRWPSSKHKSKRGFTVLDKIEEKLAAA